MAASSRRQFLAASSFAAATIVPRHVLGGPGFVPPSDRVQVALVGAGGRGREHAQELLKHPDVRLAAVIDPAEAWNLEAFYYKGRAGRVPVAAEVERHYQDAEPGFTVRQAADYRRFLDDDARDIDAVLVATPDHHHALVTVAAMRAGKAVYCEKPLTHNIREARLVARIAAETGAATQLGNQGHAHDALRTVMETLEAGTIGPVQEVHAWVPATRWNKTLATPPRDGMPLPAGIDWDLWCGPREPVRFHSAYAPVTWRDFWQFGLGAMGDFGCHDLDPAVWALGLGLPERIEMRSAGQTDPALIPYGEYGVFDFARTNLGIPLRLHWYSGGLRPRLPDDLPNPPGLGRRGTMFVGERGTIVYGNTGRPPRAWLAGGELVPPAPATLSRSPGHHREWIDAIKGGPQPGSHFAAGALLTEIALLGVLALRTGEVIHWDADALEARGVATAESIIEGDYRPGWKLPDAE
jgi:predicted dehydrogenase